MEIINTVDVKVGELIHDWIVANEQTDVIRLSKSSNLWAIVKQHLITRPDDYVIPDRHDDYISIELHDTTGSNSKAFSLSTESEIHLNPLYRCYLSEKGQARIRQYLENQLRAAFLMYMQGRNGFGNDNHEKIVYSITSFLLEYQLPVNDRILSTLQKAWYRFRKKDEYFFRNTIFF